MDTKFIVQRAPARSARHSAPASSGAFLSIYFHRAFQPPPPPPPVWLLLSASKFHYRPASQWRLSAQLFQGSLPPVAVSCEASEGGFCRRRLVCRPNTKNDDRSAGSARTRRALINQGAQCFTRARQVRLIGNSHGQGARPASGRGRCHCGGRPASVWLQCAGDTSGQSARVFHFRHAGRRQLAKLNSRRPNQLGRSWRPPSWSRAAGQKLKRIYDNEKKFATFQNNGPRTRPLASIPLIRVGAFGRPIGRASPRLRHTLAAGAARCARCSRFKRQRRRREIDFWPLPLLVSAGRAGGARAGASNRIMSCHCPLISCPLARPARAGGGGTRGALGQARWPAGPKGVACSAGHLSRSMSGQ